MALIASIIDRAAALGSSRSFRANSTCTRIAVPSSLLNPQRIQILAPGSMPPAQLGQD